MLINKHNRNHDRRHTQLPRTSRSPRIHPSASRHGLSSSQFPAEKKMSENSFYMGYFSPPSLCIFFIYPSPEKMTINSSNFRKRSKTWRYWEVCLKGRFNLSNEPFFFSRNGAKSACKPTKSTYVEYDFSSLRAGLENLIFHFGDSQIVIMIIWASFT